MPKSPAGGKRRSPLKDHGRSGDERPDIEVFRRQETHREGEGGFRDLSVRASIFRNQLIEEFRLFENRGEGVNRDAPVYDTCDFEKEPGLFSRMLKENPNQLVRFKNFKRTAEQQRMKDQVKDKRMTRIRNINTVPFGVWCRYFVYHPRVQNIIMATIISNSIILGIQAELPPEQYVFIQVLEILDIIFLMIFVFEIALKFGDNFRRFWTDNWNIFDFVVTAFSAVPDNISTGDWGIFRVIRIFRSLRSLKLIARFHNLRVIVKTVLEAFQSMAFIMLLLMLISYIYGVLADSIFATYTNSLRDDLLYKDKFSGFGNAFVTLFQLLTLDQWMYLHNDMAKVASPEITSIFYISWVCIGAFIFRNIVVGVMVKNFSDSRDQMTKTDQTRQKQKRLQRMQRKLQEELSAQNARQRRPDDTKQSNPRVLTSFTMREESEDSFEEGNGGNLVQEIQNLIQAHHDERNTWEMGASGMGAPSNLPSSMMAPSQMSMSIDPNSNAAVLNAAERTQSKGKKETVWPRDSLFSYLQTMESLQENLSEYRELQRLAAWCLHEIHDT